ncbi:MAG: hypothetical protein KGM44_02685, partial [bacterium]|nr:hypothetical protein [bacterium]
LLARYPAAQQHSTPFAQHPVGTGPYVLESWQHDDHLTLARNPRWWHRPSSIRRIEMRIVLNDQARVEAMEDGSADLYDNVGGNDYATLRRDDPHLTFSHVPSLYVGFVQTNDTLPGLREARVRQAMIYGWDRQAVVQGLAHGDAAVASGIVPPAIPYWYDPHVKPYPYDPGRARALLDAAGWRLGSGGVREKGDRHLAFTLSIPNGDLATQNTAAEFQADMRAIGIAIDVQALDWSTFLDQNNRMRYQLQLWSWGGVPDPDQYTFLDSSQLPPAGNNTSGYRNEIVDHDLRQGLKTIDPLERRALYNEMQRELALDPPFVWGMDGFDRTVLSPRVEIDTRTILPGQYIYANIWQWGIKP